MTPSQLKKYGIEFIGSKMRPRDFYVPGIGEMKIPDYYSIDDIFKQVRQDGIEEGIKRGKLEKINEIKNVLDIDYEQTYY